MKCKHIKKYFYQADSIGNTHLVLACENCNKFYKFVSLLQESDILKKQGNIDIRISKAQRRREKTGLFD